MEKQRPVDTHALSPSREEQRVQVIVNRCPYCRDDVRAEESVVCQSCLTRHHPACWEEAGHCSSCASSVAMQAGRIDAPRLITDLDVERLLEREGYRPEEIAAYFEERRDEDEGSDDIELCAWAACSARARESSVFGSSALCRSHAKRSATMGQWFSMALAVFCFALLLAVSMVGVHHPAIAMSMIVLGLGGVAATIGAIVASKKAQALAANPSREGLGA